MKIIKGKTLADLTTFRIGGESAFFCSVTGKEELKEAVNFAQEKKLQIFILGGGSNILVKDAGFDGLVIKIEVKGIEESKKQEAKNTESFFIRAGAGENWDDFVAWTVKRGLGGLENLSLIPGTVGAAPVQNIGAYGVEVGDYVDSVEVFDIKENIFKNLSHKECGFSYRDSLFKKEKGRYVIIAVFLELKKNATPDVSYKDLKEYFMNNQKQRNNNQTNTDLQPPFVYPSILQVREAVISIRTAKLPDVRKVGTAGSFFKNPLVPKEKFDELKEKYPDLPGFPEFDKADNRIKIPIAWVIDHICGLKGKRFGAAGIHDTQALVIVNYGGATFGDVENVAREVEKMVKEKTGIEIEREVVMV